MSEQIHVNNERTSLRPNLWSALVDVVMVFIFVAIGRRNHDGTVDAEGVFDVAAPFLIAVAIMWVIVLLRHLPPLSSTTGLALWIGTVTLGMIMRKVIFDGGTATAFVIVATVFLGIALNGWRAIARWRLA
jgi:hypothetical protein